MSEQETSKDSSSAISSQASASGLRPATRWLARRCWSLDRIMPRQPFSVAGKKGGHEDERHLWPVWFDLIRERRPPVVFGEQVASRDGLDWLDAVQADLEAANYAVGALDLCAAGVGAPHIRQRVFFVAYDNDARSIGSARHGYMDDGKPRAASRRRKDEPKGHEGRR